MRHTKYKLFTWIALCTILISVTACSKRDGKESKDNLAVTDAESIEVSNMEGDKDNMDYADELDWYLWSFKTEGGISSSPIMKDNRIYFGSKDGNFYSVDTITQQEVWRYTTGTPILNQAAIVDNTLYFSGEEVYYAVDATTGAELWKHELVADNITKARKDKWDYHDSSPVIDQGVVYYGSGTGRVIGFDSATSEIVWEYEVEGNIAVRSTPLINDGVIYFGDWSGRYQAVDLATRHIIWQNTYKSAFQNSAVIKEDTIFIGGRDTKIYALDIATGEEKWSFRDPSGSWFTGDPVIDGELLYFPTSDAKKVYVMNINDGTVQYYYPIYKNSFSKAIIDKGLLYISSGDAYQSPGSGKLEVYKLGAAEQSLWDVSIKTGSIFTTPLIANGVVYIGSEDGNLYAIAMKR